MQELYNLPVQLLDFYLVISSTEIINPAYLLIKTQLCSKANSKNVRLFLFAIFCLYSVSCNVETGNQSVWLYLFKCQDIFPLFKWMCCSCVISNIKAQIANLLLSAGFNVCCLAALFLKLVLLPAFDRW